VKQPLRAAVIGLGVGEQHVAGYEAHPSVEVVAICDVDEAKLAQVAARHPGPDTTTDPAAVLADPAVDVVSIASYDDAHFAQVREALERGKHVFAEKPLCLHEHEAREIARLLRARPELRLAQNTPLRMSPRFVELRERVAAGELGRIFHAEGDYDYGRRHKLTDGWRGRLPWYSVVLGGAIHMVDLLLWLTGDTPVEATALSSRIATAGTRFEHDDFVIALLRLESGATAKVTANLGCVSRHFHGLRVYGTDGTFVNGLPDATLYRPEPPPAEATPVPVTTPYPGVAKGDLIGGFVDAILGAGTPAVTESEVFDVLSVCFAIERSAREGGPVAVERLH
jgi:predicted dehydrogenase